MHTMVISRHVIFLHRVFDEKAGMPKGKANTLPIPELLNLGCIHQQVDDALLSFIRNMIKMRKKA
jgi:hypothetical protein